jgi:hypothetical protein
MEQPGGNKNDDIEQMKKELDANQHELDMQRKAFQEEIAMLRKMQEESTTGPAEGDNAAKIAEVDASKDAEAPAAELAILTGEAAASDGTLTGGAKTPDAKPVEASGEDLAPAPAAAMQACVCECVFV